MTPSRDDVIRWMDAAGFPGGYGGAMRLWESDLARFAAMVAQDAVTAEREACAKSCRDFMEQFDQYAQSGDLDEAGRMHREGASAGAKACEAAIRARSAKP